MNANGLAPLALTLLIITAFAVAGASVDPVDPSKKPDLSNPKGTGVPVDNTNASCENQFDDGRWDKANTTCAGEGNGSGSGSGGGGNDSDSNMTTTMPTTTTSATNTSELPGTGDIPLKTVFVLLAIVSGGVLLIRSRGTVARLWRVFRSDTGPTGGGDDDEDDDAVAAVSEAAGAAADHIADASDETADFENEVYQAWAEMTRHLDIDDPEVSTPAEFADAAVEAGLERPHVEQLTQMFEEVRYGGHAPTEDREKRARHVLRDIERQYGDSD